MEKTITIDIKGMTCGSCVARVEKVLKKNSSIKEAQVNLATEKGKITFDDSSLSPERIVSIVSDAGYDASLETQKKKP